jgi:flagellar protein FlaI
VSKEGPDAGKRKDVLRKKLENLIEKSPSIKASSTKIKAYADIVSREMGGYGLIDYLLDDDKLEEIMVVPPERDLYVFHRKHGMLGVNIELDTDEYVRNIIERIARDVGRRIDVNYPLLDARLPSGDRVNATLPPASLDGPTLTIRKFRQDPYTILDLIGFGTVDNDIAGFLWLCVEGFQAAPSNILVTGGTGPGKTTFVNCLPRFVRRTERIVSIEDTAELKLPIKHWVRTETRPPGLEGTGEITMDVLLKNALRMRPDRMIVGEVRHSEAFTLFTAMNTGHQGSMGTIHANTAEETLVRLMSPPMNVPEQMATALDLIIVLNKIVDPKKGHLRRLVEIAEITGKKKPDLNLIYARNAAKDSVEHTGADIQVLKKISSRSGIDLSKLQEEVKVRANLLKAAAEKNISGIDRFSTFVHKYYEKLS